MNIRTITYFLLSSIKLLFFKESQYFQNPENLKCKKFTINEILELAEILFSLEHSQHYFIINKEESAFFKYREKFNMNCFDNIKNKNTVLFFDNNNTMKNKSVIISGEKNNSTNQKETYFKDDTKKLYIPYIYGKGEQPKFKCKINNRIKINDIISLIFHSKSIERRANFNL